MGVSGKVVGAVIGTFFGGPIGAAAGAGIGHLFDSDDDDAPSPEADTAPPPRPTVNAIAELRDAQWEVAVLQSGPGYHFTVELREFGTVPEDAFPVARLRSEGAYVRSDSKEWADDDGDLLFSGWVSREEDGTARCHLWLPFGALPGKQAREVTLEAQLHTDDAALTEHGHWEVQLPTRRRREVDHQLGAVVVAATELAAQEGGMTQEAHGRLVQLLTEWFELDELGKQMVAVAVARAQKGEEDLSKLLAHFQTNDEQAQLLCVLEEVAGPGGALPSSAKAFLSSIGESFGFTYTPPDVEAPEPAAPAAPSPYEVLELTSGATWEEVRAAHRRLATDYHPDKVATMPKGFQVFATEKMQQINEAYAELRRRNGS